MAFWVYGVLLPLIFGALFPMVMVMASATRSIVAIMGVMGGAVAVFFAYCVVVYVGIWRSAGNYEGPVLWSWLARIAVIVSVISLCMSILNGLRGSRDTKRNSYNIESLLEYDKDYPLAGFWKKDCSENFGLAVEKAGYGKYSVSFCGPGGCFKQGTYRPNTTIVDDPNYRVKDENTLEVKGLNGFSAYHRCNK